MSGSKRTPPRLVADKRYSKSQPKKRATKPAKKRAAPKRKQAPKSGIGRLVAWVLFPFKWLILLTWKIAWRGATVATLILAAAVGYIYLQLPEVGDLVDGRARGSVTLLDNEGRTFAWRGDQFGGMVTTDTVAPVLKNAIVASEDKRFYRHLGISPRGVASAIRINLREGRGAFQGHGGSTITQQTAKLLCLGVPYDPTSGMTEAEYERDCRRGSMSRKAKEAIYALAMEAKYSKDEILTIYLNRAYLGEGARGVEAAAQRYFGKSAAEVNGAEAAMLSGLLPAPSRYAPTNNLERSQARANVVVGLMEAQGYLSKKEAEIARLNPATLSQAAQARAGGYFADWVMSTGPDFLTRDTTEDVILKTTLDPRIQTAAEDAMKFIFETKVREGSKAEAAIVVMSSDGAVRAMVGGRKTKVSGAFNRATMAKRQTGSAFKPFVYAAALDLGYHHNDTVVDEPITIDVPGSGPWSPKNYTNRFAGRVSLTTALKDSLNIPAVKVSEFVGRENVKKIANDFGIESDLAAGPALALGASESTLLEMTGAYAGILNGGRSVEPYGLTELRLLGDDTELMGQAGGMGERVISENAARELTYMMSQVVDRGTGVRAKLKGRQAAAKTGTTNSARDAWFIGFTADYVVGVWMGYDDNTPLTGVTGGGLPADIWRETMVRVNEGLEARPLPMITPEPPRAVEQVQANSRNAQRTQRQQQREQRRQQRRQQNERVVEKVLIDVLRDIFGGNR